MLKHLSTFLTLLFVALWCAQNAYAGIDIYQFGNAEKEKQFRNLVEELRCPKCQNQNLADSNAGLAKDLKDRTYQLVKEGKSDKEIKAYLVERYGDFIIYRPPFRFSTALLWLGPVFVFLLVFGILIRKRLQKTGIQTGEMSTKERERLSNLLENKDSNET